MVLIIRNIPHVEYNYKYQHYSVLLDLLTYLPQDKIAAISQTTFSNAFSWLLFYFDSNFTEVCS